MEGLLLAASVVLIGQVGTSFHRWLWAQTAASLDRAAMEQLATTLRAVQFKAATQHRMFELRIDPARNSIHVIGTHRKSGGMIATVEQAIWLPPGLSISEAPSTLTAFPTGELSPGAIVVVSTVRPTRFHMTTSRTGMVRLYEEPIL